MTTTARHRPLIGVGAWVEQARWQTFSGTVALLEHEFLDKLRAAGAAAVVVPPRAADAERVASVLDGLVLAGGGDVDPARYGAVPDPRSDPPQHERDDGELALVRAMLARGRPLLAVCRGCQLLNVACGGTLLQHLQLMPGGVRHRLETRPGDSAAFARHDVRVAPEDPLAEVLGERVEVLSSHHQAIDRLGGGLAPVAWAEDGVVEAVRLSAAGFAVGVQWHPEAGEDAGLFAALVRACHGEVT